ncbi:MAG TPA: succinate dehydrogenase/fumarate reductase iron-sulfur subunit [Verrucomicrobiae bacterium]|nr:succinate dehydrogenase/fumarate reductase iron-sulfur subunit [Verrucomicrobiae bacterium]
MTAAPDPLPSLRITYDDGVTGRSATLRVWRGDATGGGFVDYEVPLQEGMVVLDAVHWIQAHRAPDLACRWNCKAGKCGSCSAEINGRPALLCKTRIEAVMRPTDPVVVVQPMQAFPIVRDLVTDVSWNYEVNRSIQPFTPAPGEQAPFIIHEADIARVEEHRRCIECFLCQDVCHVLREHQGQAQFFGPRFMVRLASLEMHPKDVADRLPQLAGEAGVMFCNITKCCTEVCPEHIKITDNAIIPLKERLADRQFDPLRMLWRRLRPVPMAKPPPPG